MDSTAVPGTSSALSEGPVPSTTLTAGKRAALACPRRASACATAAREAATWGLSRMARSTAEPRDTCEEACANTPDELAHTRSANHR